MSALDHEYFAADELGERQRPVAERRQRSACRQADAYRGDAHKIAPLHDGIDEVRCTDDNAIDRAARDVLMAGEGGERR
jgi:hypothetical protein